MVKHENTGINHLNKMGYNNEDIVTNVCGSTTISGTPDLTTINNNQYWDIKNKVDNFTSAQVNMPEETNVLLLNSKDNLIENITFLDLLSDEMKYKTRSSFDQNMILPKGQGVLHKIYDKGNGLVYEDKYEMILNVVLLFGIVIGLAIGYP